ncbi:MAG TPA: CPBP family intramembrane glutamic endopeptidase, partial [Thermoanaerobaculia bacterium]|nr:CPBP family intramembrane glutamic endopeptidase [Thermoanaerobaculia bacterium]
MLLTATALLALLGAFLLDWLTARRGLLPPGFREPWRRGAALLVIATLFWIGITSPLSTIGQPAVETDLSAISTPQLFLLHILMILVILSWFLLGFAGVRREPVPIAPPPSAEPPGWTPAEATVHDEATAAEALAASPPPPVPVHQPPADLSLARQFAAQFGFLAPSIPREIGLGVVLGVGAWVAVLAGIMAFALALYAIGFGESLPKQPPALIPFIASLPIALKILISLSAGVVEEWFFRGFLQPRMGILLSTVLFALAHFSYGQPFMLVGITLLSLIYGLLVKWRQNIWPAIAAHTLFDAV